MSDKNYDLIVIGGGQHGLTLAGLSAGKGLRTLVLESNSALGGLARKEEFHPGFFSAGVHNNTSTVSAEVVDALNLSKYGLSFHQDSPGVLVTDRNGPGIHLHQDPIQCFEEIKCYSSKDAEAYKEYRDFIKHISKFGKKLVDNPPPNILSMKLQNLLEVGKTAFSLRTLGAKDMTDLLRFAPMCVADFLNNWFENQVLKAGLCGPAIYSTLTGPWSPLNTLNLMLWEIMADRPIQGGPQAVIAALEASLKDRGGEIRTDSPVETVIVEEAQARGVILKSGERILSQKVASSLDPKTSFLKLISPEQSSAKQKQVISLFRSRGTTAKVDLAVKGDLKWRDRAGAQFEFVRTGQSLDQVEKSFDVTKYRGLPEVPTLDIFVPTVSDSSLAPEGHHVVSVLTHFVPYNLKETWNDASKSKLFNAVISTLEDYSPGIGQQVQAHRLQSPVDIEANYGVSGGQLHHGELAVDQFLPRPVPGMDQYKTPIKNYFLCGSGCFPSGGMSLRNGALASKVVL